MQENVYPSFLFSGGGGGGITFFPEITGICFSSYSSFDSKVSRSNINNLLGENTPQPN